MSINCRGYLISKVRRCAAVVGIARASAPNYSRIFVQWHNNKFMISREFPFGGLQNAFAAGDKNTLTETGDGCIWALRVAHDSTRP